MVPAAQARDAIRAKDYGRAIGVLKSALNSFETESSPQARHAPMSLISRTDLMSVVAASRDRELLLQLETVARAIGRADDGSDLLNVIEACRESMNIMGEMFLSIESASANGITESELSRSFPRAKSRLSWMEKLGDIHRVEGVVKVGPAPASAEPPSESKVPKLLAYFPDTSDLESEAQRSFYRDFCDAAVAGRFLDLEDNYTYAFLLIKERFEDKHFSEEEMTQLLGGIVKSYPSSSSLTRYARRWMADIQLSNGDFQAAFESISEQVELEIFINFQPWSSQVRLTPAQLTKWVKGQELLTDFARTKGDEIDAYIKVELDRCHDHFGQNLVAELWEQYFVREYTSNTAEHFNADLEYKLGELGIKQIIQDSKRGNLVRHNHEVKLFFGMPSVSKSMAWPCPWKNTYWLEQIVRAKASAIYREAENSLRRQYKLPAVGEGWVSEMQLLHLLREAFPKEQIVHQARPEWLGRQSFDIFFPSHGLAIEYQGEQHSAPVERFGGDAAFEIQKARDSRKKRLSEENGVRLLEVFPGYEVAQVIREVSTALQRSN